MVMRWLQRPRTVFGEVVDDVHSGLEPSLVVHHGLSHRRDRHDAARASDLAGRDGYWIPTHAHTHAHIQDQPEMSVTICCI